MQLASLTIENEWASPGSAIIWTRLNRAARQPSGVTMLYRFFLLFACTLLQATAAAPDAGGFTPLPPKQPSEAVATFDLDANFRVELVAAEPLIADPVALSFDENGVLYVVEMRDYSERRDERLGRVTRLEDVDHDGRMDRATRFAEDLPWPTGIIAYDGGVFVVAAPDLWFFKDTDGDGVADVRKIVFTGFGELALDRPGNRGYNVQQLPNSLRWGPDQRIHVAEGGNGSRVRRPKQPAGEALVLRGQDLSFDPRTFDLRAVNGGGQNGMAFDDWGRKFVSSNSRHLMQVAYLDSPALNGALLLPSPTQDIAVDGPAAPVFRRSPDEAWRVARTRWRVAGLVPGPIEGGGTPSGYFTGATGVQIYRGDLFSAEFRGSAWIADCGSNLIHRKRLRQDGVLMQGSRFDGDGGREVLASTDNWFRPVQFENGPDGALYVLDLYREIIEHPWSLPPGIKEHLDLNRGNDRGRIWRIVPVDGKPRRRVTLGELTSAQLVETLGHPNGWHRDAAARLLSQRQEASALPLLAAALRSDNRHQRLGALSVLASQRQIDESALIGALADPEAMVRWRALELARKGLSAERWLRPNLTDRMKQLAADPAPEVRFTVALLLGDLPLPSDLAFEVWATLAPAAGNDPFQQRAIARFMTPHAPSAVERLIVQAGELPATALALDLIRVAAV
ncbi:MAG TPA: hypothetical protein DCY13_04700, partial [Verrucomicrobiales bacterium]|nr:hypothetical protein [Verrucomicrobiales bacterium]